MDERSGIFHKSLEDTRLCISNKPKYSKLKSQMKCSQPIERVEYRSIGVRKDRQSKNSFMKSGTQTENIGILKRTNTSPGKANPADHPHTDEPVLAISTDDMILDLHSKRKNRSAIQACAQRNFTAATDQRFVIRSNSDLFISVLFASTSSSHPLVCLPMTVSRKLVE